MPSVLWSPNLDKTGNISFLKICWYLIHVQSFLNLTCDQKFSYNRLHWFPLNTERACTSEHCKVLDMWYKVKLRHFINRIILIRIILTKLTQSWYSLNESHFIRIRSHRWVLFVLLSYHSFSGKQTWRGWFSSLNKIWIYSKHILVTYLIDFVVHSILGDKVAKRTFTNACRSDYHDDCIWS